MNMIIVLLSMLFCHVVDDYYLQGWLASAKQKKYWEENAPDDLYKHDYICALATHAFSWSFMIHVPIFICMMTGILHIPVLLFMLIFVVNCIVHAYVDNAKANLFIINLVFDQSIHWTQIIATWLIYEACVLI